MCACKCGLIRLQADACEYEFVAAACQVHVHIGGTAYQVHLRVGGPVYMCSDACVQMWTNFIASK